MPESQFVSDAEKQAFQAPPTPELDEALWRAWKDKNRAKDRVRAARRKRVFVALFFVGLTGLALARLYAGV